MQSRQSFWLSSQGFAALALIGAVSYFLLMEHRQHLFQFLPLLIVLLCPLLHIFMHGGHRHKGPADHDYHAKDDDGEAYRRGVEEGRRLSGAGDNRDTGK